MELHIIIPLIILAVFVVVLAIGQWREENKLVAIAMIAGLGFILIYWLGGMERLPSFFDTY